MQWQIDQVLAFVGHPFLLGGLSLLLLIYIRLVKRGVFRLPKIPLGFFLIFLIVTMLTPYAERLHWFGLWQFLNVTALLALFFGIIRLAAYIITDVIIGPRKAITIPGITRDVILVVLYIIVIMIVLRQKLDIDVTSLVATSAILTAVIGLALQDTLGNLFSGLALNIEKPYKLGDWVTFDKYRGQVKEVSWRSTTLLTPEHETIVVPNNVISKSHIVNYSDPSTLIVSGFFLGLEYGISPGRVREVLLATLRDNPQVLAENGMEVRLVDYGDHAIKYEVRYWMDIQDDYERADRIKAEILTTLWYRLRRTGIRIPYPIRVQYQAKEPAREEVLADIERVLRTIDLFGTLQPADLKLLTRNVTALEFAAGEEIVRQDEAGECMYVIAGGACEVLAKGPRGRQVSLAVLDRRGSFFGEMSLMTGEKRSATVIAKTDVVLYEIAKDDIVQLLAANPAISTALSEALAKRLAEKTSAIAAADASEHYALPPTAGQLLSRIKLFFGI